MKHAFQAVQMLHGKEQILDTFTVTQSRSADEAYHAAEDLCAEARALPFKPAAFVREIGAEPTEFSKRQVTVTLTGAQWTALLARVVRVDLSPNGKAVYNEAIGSLQAQLLAKAQREDA